MIEGMSGAFLWVNSISKAIYVFCKSVNYLQNMLL